LKVRKLKKAYSFTDEEIKNIKIDDWNKTMIGNNSIGNSKTLDIDLFIFGRVDNQMNPLHLASAGPRYLVQETGQPLVGVVNINTNVNTQINNTNSNIKNYDKSFNQKNIDKNNKEIIDYNKKDKASNYKNILPHKFLLDIQNITSKEELDEKILALCKNNKYFLTNLTKFINLFFPIYKNKHIKIKDFI
jgi:hypothetical protein